MAWGLYAWHARKADSAGQHGSDGSEEFYEALSSQDKDSLLDRRDSDSSVI